MAKKEIVKIHKERKHELKRRYFAEVMDETPEAKEEIRTRYLAMCREEKENYLRELIEYHDGENAIIIQQNDNMDGSWVLRHPILSARLLYHSCAAHNHEQRLKELGAYAGA